MLDADWISEATYRLAPRFVRLIEGQDTDMSSVSVIVNDDDDVWNALEQHRQLRFGSPVVVSRSYLVKTVSSEEHKAHQQRCKIELYEP